MPLAILGSGRRPRVTITVAALGAAVVALAGCGSSSPAATSSAQPAGNTGTGGTGSAPSVQIDGVGAVSKDAAAAAKLPGDIAKSGTITVATNAPYQPFIDFAQAGDTTKFKGLDYDLLQAIGGKLGVKVTFVQQPFDGLVPGLQAGKYAAIVGGITDNKAREETATFVDYSASGTGILVPSSDTTTKTLADLCGKQVAVQKAAKQVQLLQTFSSKSCGGKPIQVTEYPQNTDTMQALLAGKADAVVATKVNLVDAAAQVGSRVKVLDDPAAPNGYQASPNGIGVLKSDAGLADAMQAALQSLMDDGTYAKILAKWKQEPIAVKQATLNAAVD